jgi:hypothetical protein
MISGGSGGGVGSVGSAGRVGRVGSIGSVVSIERVVSIDNYSSRYRYLCFNYKYEGINRIYIWLIFLERFSNSRLLSIILKDSAALVLCLSLLFNLSQSLLIKMRTSVLSLAFILATATNAVVVPKASIAKRASGFLQKCTILALLGTSLQAQCDDEFGELVFDAINLDKCIGFADNDLVAVGPPSFTPSRSLRLTALAWNSIYR